MTTSPKKVAGKITPSLHVLAREAVKQAGNDLGKAKQIMLRRLLANDHAILNAIIDEIVSSAIATGVHQSISVGRKSAKHKARVLADPTSTQRMRARAQAAFATRAFWDEFCLGDGTPLGDATKPMLAADIAALAKDERTISVRRQFEQAVHDKLPNNRTKVRNSNTLSDQMVREMLVTIESAAA